MRPRVRQFHRSPGNPAPGGDRAESGESDGSTAAFMAGPSRDDTGSAPSPSREESQTGSGAAGITATERPVRIPTAEPPSDSSPSGTPGLAAAATLTPVPPAGDEAGPPKSAAHPFALPSAPKGDLISLESYLGRKNVVLVFYRGFW